MGRVQHHLSAVHRSGWLSNFGPAEQLLRERLGARFEVDPAQVLTAANATLGLAGCLAISSESEWSIPSFTFTATAAAAQLAFVSFRFVDVNPDDWWSTTGNPRLTQLMVAPFGSSVEIPSDRAMCHGRIIDAAASLGNPWSGSRLGESDAAVFSLHATKVLGAGEGAIVVFGSAELAQRFRSWSNFGFMGARDSRSLGINAKMSEIQAAYVHAALDGWDEERAEWLAARELALSVGDEVGITTFRASRESITPYWIAVFPDASTTNLVERVMEEHGIGTRRWWSRGCHRMPAYANVPHGPLPVTEDIADRYLGLPMFRELSNEDAERIHTALLDARDRAEAW